MKKFLLFCFLLLGRSTGAFAAGFDIKTSSIIDQPAIEVLGDYNGSWYVIGFEKPNHPDKPARFYILKYAAGFPTAKVSPVYPPFGEKTDYLKSAIIHGKICVFYSRTEHLSERPDMVDSRDGYKQIPKIMCQQYDPLSLLPTGEAFAIFDEAKEHFAASGIDIAQSEDHSKTAVLIKHYFRQSKFRVLLFDNNQGPLFQNTFDLKTERYLVNFRRMVVGNDGQIFMEAKTQEDPLHPYTKGKKMLRYYFFSINNHGDEPKTLNLAEDAGSNQYAAEPMIAILNTGNLLVSYERFANDHSPVMTGISVAKYKSDFTVSGAGEITPDPKFITRASAYQNTKAHGLEFVETLQILPLKDDNFMLVAEYHRTTPGRDKVSGSASTLTENNYLITYRLNNTMAVTTANFIDKKQSTHSSNYAFSARAYHKGNEVYLFHNDDCDCDGEHGLSLYCTNLPANGGEPVTQKIVGTSDDFFISLQQIYTDATNRILFTEEKVVDFTSESRELKLVELRLR